MEIFDQITAVVLVLGLTVGVVWWLRRRGVLPPTLPRGAAGKRLEILERLPLGPQQTLHLVRLGDKALLLAVTPAGCALLESADLRVSTGVGVAAE